MDVEGRFERQKVKLEDTEKARGISRVTKASYKEYADKYKKLKECQFMFLSVFRSTHKYGYSRLKR